MDLISILESDLFFLSTTTSSIAPSSALMPLDIFMPSRAGPAAQEQVTILPLSIRAISPFVPISINRYLFLTSIDPIL